MKSHVGNATLLGTVGSIHVGTLPGSVGLLGDSLMDFFTGSLDTAIHAAIGHLPKRKWKYTLGYSYVGDVQLSASAMFNHKKNTVRIALWPEGQWDEARAAVASSVLASKDGEGKPLYALKDYGPVPEMVLVETAAVETAEASEAA